MAKALENMTVLVAGASSGIGRATGMAFAERGAKVAFVSRREAELKKRVQECGSLTTAYPCDLTDDAKVKELAIKIKADFGRLDVLVHSFGTIKEGNIEDSSIADLDAQYAANVRAPYLLTQQLLPLLRSAAGQIVFVNSTISRAQNTAGRGQFSATQRAIRAIANSLRDEVHSDGVRITSIFPGTTATPRQISLYEKSSRPYDPRRLLQPEDVAECIIFAVVIGRTAEVTELFVRPMLKALF
jgi:NAD(P)-dependent dehydrogenase (short-subunit alcohol dehydrogenase family)